MNIIFMGTPEFSVPVLEALAQHHHVVCVYTQPPRPSGRGHKVNPSPVQQVAERLGIPVRTPVSLRKPDAQAEFASFNADVAVVCAYGLILPQPILEAPKLGCINVHASLLPRWRGAAPIQRAIQAGDTESGVTIMKMDVGLDTGDMLLKGSCAITPDTTAQMLHDSLASIGAELIIKALADLPTPQKQPAEGVTYAEKIQKEEALIDWSLPAIQIKRNIMAFNPFPVAYTTLNGERIKIYEADVSKATTSLPAGTLIDDTLSVACGDHTVLRIRKLQREGKRAMTAEEFMLGSSLKQGERFAV